MKSIAFCFWKSKYTANSLFSVVMPSVLNLKWCWFASVQLIWFDFIRLQTKKHFKAWSNISSKIWNKGTPNDCYRSEPSKWWYSINKNRAKNVLLLLLRYLLHMQFSSGGRRTSISNHRLFLVLCSFFIVFFLDIYLCMGFNMSLQKDCIAIGNFRFRRTSGAYTRQSGGI